MRNPALLLSIGTGRPDPAKGGSGDGRVSALLSECSAMLSRAVGINAGLQNLITRFTAGKKLHARLREFARGEHTWYKRLSISYGLGSAAFGNWVEEDCQDEEGMSGSNSYTMAEEATRTYLERDFDPKIDSYAPPKVMLSQIAQKLVRQRRAREHQGGERWKTFVGEHLHKFSGGKTRSAHQAEAGPVQGKQGKRISDDVSSQPDLKSNTSAKRRVSVDLDLNTQHIGDASLSSSSIDLEILEASRQSQDHGPIEELSIEESLLKSILKPTETVRQVETTQQVVLAPLLSHLRCLRLSESTDICQLSCRNDSPSLLPLCDLLQALVDVLQYLKRHGLCGDAFYFFKAEDRTCQVLHAEAVPCRNIELVYHEAQIARDSGSIFHLKSMTEELLEHLDI